MLPPNPDKRFFQHPAPPICEHITITTSLDVLFIHLVMMSEPVLYNPSDKILRHNVKSLFNIHDDLQVF